MKSLTVKNLKKAFASLPNPEKYQPETITVAVGLIRFTFVKVQKDWQLKVDNHEKSN